MSDYDSYGQGETEVVNLKQTNEWDVYIGREGERDDLTHSQFANPYTLSEYERGEAVQLYKWDFYYKILAEQGFLEDVFELEGKVLACWCHPEFCHGDIIVDFIHFTKKKMDEHDITRREAAKEYIMAERHSRDSSRLSVQESIKVSRIEGLLEINTSFESYK